MADASLFVERFLVACLCSMLDDFCQDNLEKLPEALKPSLPELRVLRRNEWQEIEYVPISLYLHYTLTKDVQNISAERRMEQGTGACDGNIVLGRRCSQYDHVDTSTLSCIAHLG